MSLLSRRVVFWVLLLAFVGLFAWWTLHIPYDERALYRAIPPNATVISVHDDVARRWPDIAANQAVEGLLGLFGAGLPGPPDAAWVRDAQHIVDLFAARRTVLAFVPALGPAGQPAWIVSSWAGGNVQPLRWRFLAKQIPGLRRQRLADGARAWVARLPEAWPGPAHLSLAVADGVLLGCMAEDPLGVQWLVRRVYARVPPAAVPRRDDPSVTDRGWVSGRELGFTSPGAGISYQLRDCNETVLAGSMIRSGARDAGTAPATRSRPVDGLVATYGDVQRLLARPADIFMAAHFDQLAALLRSVNLLGVAERVTNRVADIQPETDVFAALFGGVGSGRILGLRVPTIIVGIRVKKPKAVLQMVDTILDDMNAQNAWALIPRRSAEADPPVVVIDSTRGGVYSSMSPGERPALTARGDWLIFASNVARLDHLVPLQEPAGDGAASVWMPPGGLQRAGAYVWADMYPAGQSIRNILAVSSLGLLARKAPDRAAQLDRLGNVKSLVEAFQTAGTCAVWVAPGEGEFAVHFRVERADKKP